MVEVITDKPVGDGSLGAGNLKRGVSIDHAGGDIEARVGNAPGADAAIVVGQILDEPFNGVVGIGGFIDILGGGLGCAVRCHVDELPFAHVLAANVLIDDDVAVFGQRGRRADVGLVLVGAIRGDAVGRAVEKDGVLLRLILRDVDAGEEALAIAHGYAVLVLGVVRLYILKALGSQEHREAQREKNRSHEFDCNGT